MKHLLLVLVLILVMGGCASVRSLTASTHELFIKQSNGYASCTSTAIGKHALLTAEHCMIGVSYILDNDKEPLIISQVVRDGQDHVILLLSGKEFKYFSELAPNNFYLGQSLYVLGMHDDYYDYREGHLSGAYSDKEGLIVVIDLRITYGDSGSAVFDKEGNIIGVIKGTVTLKSDTSFVKAYMLPMRFKDSDYKLAKGF